MIDFRRLGTVAMFLILLAAGPARAAPEVGWWWNPNESGRGFFVESQNGIMYLAGYFYESDGRATWLVSGGPNTDSYNYQGRLLSYSNGQTLFGDYKPPNTPTDAGPVSISFSDDTHGSIVWPGGTIPIVRQVFGGESADTAPEVGWWWNDAESGRGYSVEVQGDKLFVVAFMYDAAGNPVWYYSAGTMSTPTTYAGTWLQFAGGQTLTGPYRPPGAPVVVGQLNIEFTAPDAATLTLRDGAAAHEPPAVLPKKSKFIEIKRQFKKPKPPRPDRWIATLVVEDKTVNSEKPAKGVGFTQLLTWKWEARDVLMERNGLPSNGEDRYYAQSGFVDAEPTFFYLSSNNKELCESTPNQSFTYAMRGKAVELVVNSRDESFVFVDVPGESPLVVLACVSDGKQQPPSTRTLPLSLNFSLPMKPLDAGVVQGKALDQVILDYDDGVTSSKRTISVRWAFSPAK